VVAASSAPSGGHGSQLLVGMAVALLEAAASLAITGGRSSWDPIVCLYAAADQAWGTPPTGELDWRTDRSSYSADFRLAVLLAEAAAAHALDDGGYLSGRQLAVDLRRGAAWLAGGLLFAAPVSSGGSSRLTPSL
jgi:hypothetical protein